MAPPAYTKTRRCKYFSNSGEPRYGGCIRGRECWYTHPEDQQWAGSKRHVSRSRSRDKYIGTRRRYSSRSRSRSPLPGPRSYRDSGWRGRRRDSIASSVGDDSGFRPPAAPASFQAPRSPVDTKPDLKELSTQRRQLEPQASIINSEEPPPPGLSERTNSRGQSSSMSQPPTPTVPPPLQTPIAISQTPIHTPSQTPTFPPQTPTISAASPHMQPPPPLPDAPEFDEVDSDVKGQWEERVSLLADMVEASQELNNLRKNREELRLFADSTQLPDDQRPRYHTKLAEVNAKYDAQEAKLNDMLNTLTHQHVWPISQKQMERDAELQEKYNEMVAYVVSLKDMTGELSKALAGSGIKPPPAPPAVLGQPEDAMDVDQPAKGPVVSNEELDDVLEKLSGLEGSITLVENTMAQAENETREEFKYALESRFEELKAHLEGVEVEQGSGGGGSVGDPNLEAMNERLVTMTNETETANADLTEITGVLEVLHARIAKLEEEIKPALADYDAALEKQAELQKRLQACTSQQEEDARALESLQSMLKSHLQRPPSPPASPRIPSSEILLQAMQEPLTSAMRKAIQPAVEDVRKHVQASFDSQSAEIYGNVWDRVSGTLGMLEQIRDKLVEIPPPPQGSS